VKARISPLRKPVGAEGIRVPGDKSISHRALMFAALAGIARWLGGFDALNALGVKQESLAIWVVGAFVMAFVLVHAIRYAGATGAAQGAAVGFFNWLGFVLIVILEEYAAARYAFKLVAIKSGAYLVELVVMGIILASWA